MKNSMVYINAKGEPHGNCTPLKRNDGKEYGSFRETMIANNISYTALRKAIDKGTELKGYRYALADDKDQYIAIMESSITEMKAERKANDELIAKAAAWDRYMAEQEAARKAEEKRQKAIEKAKARVERLNMEVERKYELYLAAMEKLKDAAFELKELEDNGNGKEN